MYEFIKSFMDFRIIGLKEHNLNEIYLSKNKHLTILFSKYFIYDNNKLFNYFDKLKKSWLIFNHFLK